MANEINIKDYLETATDAAKRVRTSSIILVFTTVLLFSGLLNAFGISWMRLRINNYENRASQTGLHYLQIKEKDGKIVTDLAPEKESIEKIIEKAWNNIFRIPNTETNNDTLIEILETTTDGIPVKVKRENGWYRYTITDKNLSKIEKSLDNANYAELERSETEVEFYEALKREKFHRETIYYESYRNLKRALVENAYAIKVPFFGVAFDINDLGLIGGLSLIIVLSILRLSLRNYLLSLRMGIKASREYKQELEFYENLAGRQLFAFPTLKDSQQTIYPRNAEKFFLKIKWWFRQQNREDTTPLSHEKYDPNKEFDSKSHKVLKALPNLIFLFGTLVYLLIVINDLASYEEGLKINEQRTVFTIGASVVLLILIVLLQIWCRIKWKEIHVIWNRFYKNVLLREIYDNAHLIVEAKRQNRENDQDYIEIIKDLEKLPYFSSELEKEQRTIFHNRELLERLKRNEPPHIFEKHGDEEKLLETLIENLNKHPDNPQNRPQPDKNESESGDGRD